MEWLSKNNSYEQAAAPGGIYSKKSSCGVYRSPSAPSEPANTQVASISSVKEHWSTSRTTSPLCRRLTHVLRPILEDPMVRCRTKREDCWEELVRYVVRSAEHKCISYRQKAMLDT